MANTSITSILYSHYLYRDVFSRFSQDELKELYAFGERYGTEALVQKILGVLKERSGGKVVGEEAERSARVLGEVWGDMQLLRSQIGSLTKASQVNGERRKQAFVRKVREASLPLFRLLLPIAFYSRVVRQYFTFQEIESWELGLKEKGVNLWKEFVGELERRARKPIKELVGRVQHEVEDMVETQIVGGLQEFQALTKKQKTGLREKAVNSGSFEQLLALYMELD